MDNSNPIIDGINILFNLQYFSAKDFDDNFLHYDDDIRDFSLSSGGREITVRSVSTLLNKLNNWKDLCCSFNFPRIRKAHEFVCKKNGLNHNSDR